MSHDERLAITQKLREFASGDLTYEAFGNWVVALVEMHERTAAADLDAAVEMLHAVEPLLSAYIRGRATVNPGELGLLHAISGFNMANRTAFVATQEDQP